MSPDHFIGGMLIGIGVLIVLALLLEEVGK
jgi:hypothetical protein